MTDDIVSILKEEISLCLTDGCEACHVARDAVVEIERLREEIGRLSTALGTVFLLVSESVLSILSEAVHGE